MLCSCLLLSAGAFALLHILRHIDQQMYVYSRRIAKFSLRFFCIFRPMLNAYSSVQMNIGMKGQSIDFVVANYGKSTIVFAFISARRTQCISYTLSFAGSGEESIESIGSSLES
jgi:hypothetical protein